MNHLSEDKLLQYLLDISDDNKEVEEIKAHIRSCPGCLNILERLRNDMMVIGSIQPSRPGRGYSKKKSHSQLFYRAMRIAALLILGFGLGWGGSTLINRQPVAVSPAYITLSPPPNSVYSYVVADATSIPAENRSQASILIKDNQ